MKATRTTFLLLSAAVLSGSVLSRAGGTIPGVSSIAVDSALRGPSCTSCHSGALGASGVATRVTAPVRSLDLGEALQVTVQVTGGPAGTAGGFAAENTLGSFTSASGVQINTGGRVGRYATHTNASRRSWSVPYTAPTSPGLALVYAVGMAANGTGGRTSDATALSGFDPTATDGTPLYLGVNAAGNQRFGQGCVGSYGNWAVLFSDQAPTIGNASYAVRLAGAAPSSTAVFLFGLPRATPLDLSLIGAAGCGLWVDSLASLSARTSAGHAQRGEGSATAALPLPNTAALRGVVLGAQAVIVDLANGRSMPITATDGLPITIR